MNTKEFVFGFSIMIVSIFLLINNSQITINKSYEPEYIQCKEKLDTKEICAPCKCDTNIGGMMFFAGGLIFYVLNLFNFFKEKKEK